nr:hypothetical protein GCM10020093_108070 [Planobispora longispora]
METYPVLAAFVWIGQGPMAMALFLFGLAAGKSRLFEEPERWARLVPGSCGWGTASACPPRSSSPGRPRRTAPRN